MSKSCNKKEKTRQVRRIVRNVNADIADTTGKRLVTHGYGRGVDRRSVSKEDS